ncbi:MAG: hypothetical protein VE99_C0003G0059 [candidate division Kazan bacterium GW2011_GWC1_52_13]|nr:MAG: hypothetical protein VE99_C0003G0059 [candidate division Kazan bacterium GW2011_GWC1_52_13]
MASKKVRAWKAFRVDSKDRLRFMFHSHQETTIVPFGVWLKTKARWVRNPGKRRGKAFRAGFHCFLNKERIASFQKLTDKKYVVLPVWVRNLRPKPRTIVGAYLAQELYVPQPKEKEEDLAY